MSDHMVATVPQTCYPDAFRAIGAVPRLRVVGVHMQDGRMILEDDLQATWIAQHACMEGRDPEGYPRHRYKRL